MRIIILIHVKAFLRVDINYIFYSGFLLVLFCADISYSYQLISVEPDSASVTANEQYGYVQIHTEADSLYAYLNNDFSNVIKFYDQEKKLRLPEGYHTLLVFGRTVSQFTYELRIRANQTFLIFPTHYDDPRRINIENLSAFARYKSGKNFMIFTDSEAEIFLDGNRIGESGYAGLTLTRGAYRLRILHPSGREQGSLISVEDSHKLTLFEHYFKPTQKVAIASSILIPGAGQILKREFIKGTSITLASGFLLYSTKNRNRQIDRKINDFDNLYQRYLTSTDERIATQQGDELETLGAKIDRVKREKNAFLISALIIYGWNIFDASRERKWGFSESKKFDPYRDFQFKVDDNGVSANFQINF